MSVIIAMTNEDGAQVWSGHGWDISARRAVRLSYGEAARIVRRLRKRSSHTNRRDCPDNGFMGVYRLRILRAPPIYPVSPQRLAALRAEEAELDRLYGQEGN